MRSVIVHLDAIHNTGLRVVLREVIVTQFPDLSQLISTNRAGVTPRLNSLLSQIWP